MPFPPFKRKIPPSPRVALSEFLDDTTDATDNLLANPQGLLESDSLKEARQAWKDLKPDIRRVVKALEETGPEEPLASHGLSGFHFNFKRKVTANNYEKFTKAKGTAKAGYLQRFLGMAAAVWESFAEAIKHDPARLVKLTTAGRVAFEVAEHAVEFYKTLHAAVKGGE